MPCMLVYAWDISEKWFPLGRGAEELEEVGGKREINYYIYFLMLMCFSSCTDIIFAMK